MKKLIALILALCLALPLAACGGSGAPAQPERTDAPAETARPALTAGEHEVETLAAPQYPAQVQYPDMNGNTDGKQFGAWSEQQRERRARADGYAGALDGFLARSVPQLLAAPAGENLVCSPLNVYMALAMLAEVTGGESRAQILALLGAPDVETLRGRADALWSAHYCDDGATASLLANSLWLNQDVGFVPSTTETLAAQYRASAFRGEMGSPAFDAALQGWLNEQTAGLLEEQASGLHMDPETILALVSAICFRAKWSDGFSTQRTAPAVFRRADGTEQTCDFMHCGRPGEYYWTDRCGAVQLRLDGGGAMWFLLPDEGVSLEELIADGETMDLLRAGDAWGKSRYMIVNMAVPKFDVSSDIDLRGDLAVLGVTDVFDPRISDFSPLTADRDGVCLSAARHAARVAIDEEGVVAVAYTVMVAAGGAAPPAEEMDFVLDRPFLFAITGSDGLPLFVGAVNRPAD